MGEFTAGIFAEAKYLRELSRARSYVGKAALCAVRSGAENAGKSRTIA
jgi:hypothetical protein